MRPQKRYGEPLGTPQPENGSNFSTQGPHADHVANVQLVYLHSVSVGSFFRSSQIFGGLSKRWRNTNIMPTGTFIYSYVFIFPSPNSGMWSLLLLLLLGWGGSSSPDSIALHGIHRATTGGRCLHLVINRWIDPISWGRGRSSMLRDCNFHNYKHICIIFLKIRSKIFFWKQILNFWSHVKNKCFFYIWLTFQIYYVSLNSYIHSAIWNVTIRFKTWFCQCVVNHPFFADFCVKSRILFVIL